MNLKFVNHHHSNYKLTIFLKMPRTKYAKTSAETKEKIIKLARNGRHWGKTARDLDIARTTVLTWIKDSVEQKPRGGRRTEKLVSTRLEYERTDKRRVYNNGEAPG